MSTNDGGVRRKRCPNGTRRNKKTGLCEPPRVDPASAKRARRCPNGSRRNKKTGECEKTKKTGPELIGPEKTEVDLFDAAAHPREYKVVASHVPPGIERLLRSAILVDYVSGYNMRPAEQRKLLSELSGADGKKKLEDLTDMFSMEHLLEAWYRHYAPEKVDDIDDILEKYVYCESTMWNILYRKYVDQTHRDTPLWFYDERCEQRRRR